MASERVQRRIDALLDEAEGAFAARDWARLAAVADDALKLDPSNADAATFAPGGLERRCGGRTGSAPPAAQLSAQAAGGRGRGILRPWKVSAAPADLACPG